MNKPNMIAKLPTISTHNAKNLDGDKERITTYKVVCVFPLKVIP